jgi:hypothetical protein
MIFEVKPAHANLFVWVSQMSLKLLSSQKREGVKRDNNPFASTFRFKNPVIVPKRGGVFIDVKCDTKNSEARCDIVPKKHQRSCRMARPIDWYPFDFPLLWLDNTFNDKFSQQFN